MKYVQYETAEKSANFLKKVNEGNFSQYDDGIPPIAYGGSHPGDIEGGQIKIYPSREYQTYKGIGGALTQSAAIALSRLPSGEQNKVIEGYFGANGIRYSVARTHIGSCDFSLEPYSYIDEGDETLDTFSLKNEENNVIPMIKRVLKANGNLYIFSSPWSPVPFMKTNRDYRGGKLKKEYYGLWAKYVAKYISEYQKSGVKISAVTVQNEPRHHQLWESCNYTKEEEVDLINTALRKELPNTKIYVYDHCGERLCERANYAFDNAQVDGIAFHWYSGDYFDELSLVRERYPDKDIVMSEGCVGVPEKDFGNVNDAKHWSIAFEYSQKLSGYFKHGLTAFCDWNICLDEHFGPYHFRENRACQAYAPVICDSKGQKAVFTPTFYAIGQYSKFVEVGAKVIGVSCFTEMIKTVAFKNPDGSLVLVVHNNTDNSFEPILNLNGNVCKVNVAPKSISTFVID